MVRSPRVSVIIVNWNGKTLLQACLEALRRQSFTDCETVVVDNGSTDSSVDFVQERFPDIDLIALPENQGFSRASNVGIERTRGEYIAMLNNDAEADPNWLGELVAALEADPQVGFCASKMVLHRDRDLADACGDFYTVEGIPGKIGHLEPADRYNVPREVFGACAGAAIYRRSMLEDLGGFDEDFFIVHEDSDLSFRAQLMGYKCLYVPTAVVRHHLSATIGEGSRAAAYYAQRNMEFVFLKNMPLPLLIKYQPLHLLTDALLLLVYARQGKTRAFLKAKIDALALMPKMLEKRRQIQEARRTPTKDIERLLVKEWLWRKVRHTLVGGKRRVRGGDDMYM
jgi:hypothetical protein